MSTTTTPSEFLQFAKDMGLDRLPATSAVPPTADETHPSNLTGLAVLNNICHLIEHLHDLKMENNRLRAHLDLVSHVDRFLLRTPDHESKPLLRSTLSIHGEGTYDEEKSSTTLSPSNSLKIRKFSANSFSSKDRLGIDPVNHHEESSTFLPTDELTNSTLGLSGQSNWHNWSKVRHALRFSLRRKKSPDSSSFSHVERPIPAISISLESDDDHLQEEKRSKTMKKKKKKITTSTNLSPLDDYHRRPCHADETDQDEESIRSEDKRNIYAQHDSTYSSSHERANLSASTTLINDDESSAFTRKQSKIAHYRHKIRSKLDTVKKQFSDQMPLSRQHGSTFEEIGSGLNHAVLSAKLAPAMTKSYQQKMREWQTLQKSDFLVNYRRQSICNEIRRASIASIHADPLQSPVSLPLSTGDSSSVDLMELSPILSPNQRSLIVHQWREIMSEELAIRRKQDFLQEKLLHLKQLENNLKELKTRIFSSNDEDYFLKHRSMSSIERDSFPVLRRCRSLHAFVSMPASWILAVQSAAYSDVLDGTSTTTTERARVFNQNFFQQFKHLQDEREQFEQSLSNDLPRSSPDKRNLSFKGNTRVINRACLRKLSFPSSNPITYDASPMPMYPPICTLSPIDRLGTPTMTTSEPEPLSLDSSLSAIGSMSKRSKRSRFDLKKTLQRSKSMCVTQFHSWLQRRRQQHHSAELRRKSAVESKASKEARTSPTSTPTLFGSPRLARFRQRIFKAPHPPPPSPVIPEHVELPSLFSDDSDVQFAQRECPVRIYLPARSSPSIRHVRIVELDRIHQQQLPTPPMSKITSPIIHRRTPSTAKERRESFAAMSNIFHPT